MRGCDAYKIATLLRGGILAQAYVYPAGKRETRDLLRRRSFLVRQRGLLIAHIQNEASQYNERSPCALVPDPLPLEWTGVSGRAFLRQGRRTRATRKPPPTRAIVERGPSADAIPPS
jgi:hypothetical protein